MGLSQELGKGAGKRHLADARAYLFDIRTWRDDEVRPG